MNKIHHIGIAVKSIDDALKFWVEKLGLVSMAGFDGLQIEEVPQQKVRIASLRIGESKIELLEAADPESPVAKFIEKKGEGIHHIAFEVSEIEKKLIQLKSDGIQMIDDKPRTGAHNTKIAFIHPNSSCGVLVELVEKNLPGKTV